MGGGASAVDDGDGDDDDVFIKHRLYFPKDANYDRKNAAQINSDWQHLLGGALVE